MKSAYLRAFIKGFGSVLRFGVPSKLDELRSRVQSRTDLENLSDDWKKVGSDIQAPIDIINLNYTN